MSTKRRALVRLSSGAVREVFFLEHSLADRGDEVTPPSSGEIEVLGVLGGSLSVDQQREVHRALVEGLYREIYGGDYDSNRA